MSKVILILALCFAGQVFSQCTDNALLTKFNLTRITTPAVATNISICKSLTNADSCCSAETFTSFQTKADALLSALSDSVAARDRKMTDIRLNAVPKLTSALTRLQSAMDKLTGGQGGGLGLLEAFANVDGFFSLLEGEDKLKSDFMDFQKARATCVMELVKLETAAWCLACDPSASTKGLSGSTLGMTADVCTRISTPCYTYFSLIEDISKYLAIGTISSSLDILANAFESLANGDLQGMQNYLPQLMELQGETPVVAEEDSPVEIPQSCTNAANCNWICNTVFKNGQVDTTILARGGEIVTRRRLLASEEDNDEVVEKSSRDRMLQSGTWAPAADESAVQVDFEDDPGEANSMTASGKIITGTLACLGGLLVALFA